MTPEPIAVPRDISTGRAFDRLISMSDSIVAVAMTVNVLTIVDIRRVAETESVATLLADHAGQIGSFCFTFVIVGVMWLAHNRILNQMRGYDATIFWLNLAWLLLIALLPWPSTMFGVSLVFGGHKDTADQAGVGLFYWGTLAAISALGGLIGLHARRRPALLEPSSALDPQGQLRAWLYAAAFLVIGVASLVSPLAASWLPLALVAVSLVLRRRRRRAT